jgi:hypothetical protein|nr:hypothetical protein [Mesorhizobium alhagi]
MRDARATVVGLVLVLSALAAGCGTPKEKTAPCNRPANLSSYASEARQGCGPMAAINNDPRAALAAIDEFAE